jgi:hypothetical protein
MEAGKLIYFGIATGALDDLIQTASPTRRTRQWQQMYHPYQ